MQNKVYYSNGGVSSGYCSPQRAVEQVQRTQSFTPSIKQHRLPSDNRSRSGQQQPQQPRYMNGTSRPPGAPGPTPMPNGVIPNGLPAGPGSVMPNGTQPHVSFAGMPQVNGIPGPSGMAGGPPPQPPNMHQPHLMQGQRPGAPPQRAPNGVAPFASPTMSHSPQNLGAAGQQQQPANPPPMAQLGVPGVPQVQMARGGMLPPNGPQGPMLPAQQTPQMSFQGLARSPSQPGSPAPNTIARSPSMNAARQASGMAAQALANEVNQELNRIPAAVLNQIKEEVGLADKDYPSLTTEDKQRMIAAARQRAMRQGQPGRPPPSGPTNATAGPSTPSMQPPMQHPMQQRNAQPLQSTPQQQQQPQRGNKRSSTSPGQEPEQLPRSDASPPDRKRVRRSPANGDQPQPQPPPMAPMVPFPHPSQQGGPVGPHQMIPGMVGRPMGGFPGQPGMPNTLTMPLGATMSPGMMNHPMTPQQVQHVQQLQYRQSMQNLHKTGMQHSGMGNMVPGGNAASPSAGEGGFISDGPQSRPGTAQFSGAPGAPGANSRMGPKPLGMMPPPSPSQNPKPGQKDASGANETSAPNGRLDSSPQTGAPGPGQGSAPGSVPSTHTGPPTPNSSGNMTAPSPSAMNTSTPSMNANHAPAPSTTDSILGGLFPPDFMPHNGLDDFDPSIFRPDGELNFDRDFGDWFNSDSIGGLDPMK
ncbi:predicted protein [Sparassis crispa]|uniref:Uncharacterized protein n=1 Tax=Sparassis crispa TaxID=139825 RepID=A0A401H4T6_9APHY|nr:predicted protein [Sparassis crispa]GBE89455.1 predicted protein [Sparassis crispa]